MSNHRIKEKDGELALKIGEERSRLENRKISVVFDEEDVFYHIYPSDFRPLDISVMVRVDAVFERGKKIA